jgi:hypothetical protein
MSLVAAKKQRYPFYDDFEEIWATKASIHIPFVATSEDIAEVITDPPASNLDDEDPPPIFDLDEVEALRSGDTEANHDAQESGTLFNIIPT